MDDMTANAQGWVRESEAVRRLKASRAFAAAYRDTAAEGRVRARNPLEALQRLIFGSPAQEQVRLGAKGSSRVG